MNGPFGPRPFPRAGGPVVNLRPGVKLLLIANVVVHLLVEFAPSVGELLIDWFAFVPGADQPVTQFALTLLTYQYLHGGWGHLLVNMIWLLAFGSGVEDRLGTRRMLVFYTLCGVLAALAHTLVYPESVQPLVGASGSLSGLFGAVLLMLQGTGRLRDVVPAAAVWVGMTLAFEVFAPGTGSAWVAHLGGFAAGILLFRFFDRPRWR